MIYRCKNRHKIDGVCSSCQGHENSQEQRLNKRFKFNFETRNKIRLCNSKTNTQKLRTWTWTWTWDVLNKCENGSLL